MSYNILRVKVAFPLLVGEGAYLHIKRLKLFIFSLQIIGVIILAIYKN